MENTIQSDLIRGHINTIILKALFDGDRYGYDIVREIEQKSSGQYKLKQPTLYSCLKRLEIQGFIRSYWGAKSNGGRRKYFTLTEMGRELFIKNQSEWEYSRTVIDKLISDKEVDLSAMPAAPDEEYEQEQENIENTAEESLDGATSETDEPAHDISVENDSEVVEENNESPADTEELSPQKIAFADTTAIMNELFRRQTDAAYDESYADKLIAEKYVADKTESDFSSEQYFKDFFDESEADAQPQAAEVFAESAEIHEQETISEQTTQPPTPQFLEYNSPVPPTPSNAIIEREYRNILGDFLSASFTEPAPPVEPQYVADNAVADVADRANEPPEEAPTYDSENNDAFDSSDTDEQTADEESYENENLAAYTGDADINRKFNKLTGEVREMGDNVIIRTHNTAKAKEYSNTYYYYSNKLMLVHYGILFGIMMLEILFTAIFVNPILHAGRSSDKWFYVLSSLLAVAFPIAAFIKNVTVPNKRKRINFSLKNSLIYRLIVMAQCFLIIYCANIIAGMPLSFSSEYLTTILLPALLCTNFPVSALLFNALFKSKKFAVEQ